MEIKLQCPCGTRYAFDVEPINGKMPGPIACPECQRDGTDLANEEIATRSQSQSPPPMAIRVPRSVAPAASPIPLRPRPSEPPRASLSFGVLAAAIGGFIGFVAWVAFIKFTGFTLGYVAWGVGVLTGFAARKGMPAGSRVLGLIAAGIAFMAIIGGEYFVTKNTLDGFIHEMSKGAFEARLVYAKEATGLQTDDEIRGFLAKQTPEGFSNDPAQVTPGRIEDFRSKEQPELQKFVTSPPDKSAFLVKFETRIQSNISQWEVMKKSVGLFTLLWLFLGVGTAYKIAANEQAN